MIDISRHSGLVNRERLENLRVSIIGAGGVGSFVAITLAKMGLQNIEVWDKDDVELHNVANQFYSMGQLKKPKVEALRDNLAFYAGLTPTIHNSFWSGQLYYNPDVIIMAVDSMTARKYLWSKIKEDKLKDNSLGDNKDLLLIDTRMSAKHMQVELCRLSNKESIEYYESTLYDSSEAIQEACTAKSIIFTPMAISYTVGLIIFNEINNVPNQMSYVGYLDKFMFTKLKTEV